jgi:co-chaperonin GroES (HSP10)|tara:strand:+ start:259 stop:543 length:285 start_codon:yes stop_codon:yes gene_type:complete
MIKPLGDRIFLEKDKPIEKIGNIIIPKEEGMHAPPYSGTIIAIGIDVEDKEYEIGKRVLFHDFAGTELMFDGKTVFSLREEDITAIIDNNIHVS